MRLFDIRSSVHRLRAARTLTSSWSGLFIVARVTVLKAAHRMLCENAE